MDESKKQHWAALISLAFDVANDEGAMGNEDFAEAERIIAALTQPRIKSEQTLVVTEMDRVWYDDQDGCCISFFCPDCDTRLYLFGHGGGVSTCDCPRNWSISAIGDIPD